MARFVLVVDDDRDIRDSLIDTLAEHGHAAVGAANGLEALQVLRSGPLPCLILLDLMMPLMDGREFRIEQLKHPEWRGIPILVISAYHDVDAQARDLGLPHLRKPLTLGALIDAVRRTCTG